MPKIPWWVHPALLGAGLLYGANYSIAKEVMNHYLGPYGLNFLRVFSAVLVFWVLSLLTKSESIERKDLPRLLLCALFGASLNITLFFKGLSYTTPVNAALILTTSPIVVLVASYFLLKEKITLKQIVGIALGLTGAVLLLNTKRISFDDESFIGDLFVLLNTISYSLYLVLVKPLMVKYHAFTVLKWLFSFGLLIVGPLGFEQIISIDFTSIDSFGVLALVYVAIATTVIAYFLNVSGIKYVSSTIVGYYVYLQPLFAGLIEVIAGRQIVTYHLILSATLIFGGVFLVSSSKSKN